MTDPQDPVHEDETLEQDGLPSSDRDPMAALLKRSFAEPSGLGHPSGPSILQGVQRRIRKRSRGRFFADGWSTGDGRVNHLLIAAGMLLILVVAYFALGPMGVQ